MFTNGKGSSEKACLASALGEYFERLSCNYFFADFYLGEKHSQQGFVHYPNERWFDDASDTMPEDLMDEGLWQYFDPDNELSPNRLFDLNSGIGQRGICAVPYQRLRDKKEIYFPINIIANIFVSNGMSAGNTQNEARVQALSEIFERYVKNKIIAEGICLPEVPSKVLGRFPAIKKSIEELEKHGYIINVADASLGGQFPVMSVTLINPKDGSVFASFGAHPSFEVALERTVTELLQGRNLEQLDVFHPPIFDLDEVASPQNLEMHFIDSSGTISYDFFRKKPDYQFTDWDYDSETKNEFEFLCSKIHEMDFDIYIADYHHLDVYACRILVPGMSDIYPVDELVWENNNEGALFREDFLSLKKGDKAQWKSILERLEKGSYNDQTLAAVFIGLAPDPDTLWSTVRIGEIKAMLYLALQDEQALEWIDWCLSLEQGSDDNLRFYRCLKALLEIKWHPQREFSDYLQGLEQLYGMQNIEDGLAVVSGKKLFHGLHCPGLSLEGFERHTRLLEGYHKLQLAKQNNWQ
jgi:ribosomal protein S12 methylthiotransferase accessory factor